MGLNSLPPVFKNRCPNTIIVDVSSKSNTWDIQAILCHFRRALGSTQSQEAKVAWASLEGDYGFVAQN